MSKAKKGHFQGFVQNHVASALQQGCTVSKVSAVCECVRSRQFMTLCLLKWLFAFLPFLSSFFLYIRLCYPCFWTSKVLVFESFTQIIVFSVKPTFWKACVNLSVKMKHYCVLICVLWSLMLVRLNVPYSSKDVSPLELNQDQRLRTKPVVQETDLNLRLC